MTELEQAQADRDALAKVLMQILTTSGAFGVEPPWVPRVSFSDDLVCRIKEALVVRDDVVERIDPDRVDPI